MNLRVASPEDFDAVLDLLNKNIESSRYSFLFGNKDYNSEAVSTFLDTNNHYNCVCVVYEVDYKIVGFAAFQKTVCFPSPFHIAKLVAWYVEPEHRGKGFREEARKALEAWGRVTGCDYSHIELTKEGATLEGYDKFGEIWMKEIK